MRKVGTTTFKLSRCMAATLFFACALSLTHAESRHGTTKPDPVRVLIIDGQNNHEWIHTTKLMKAMLETSSRFVVEVATTPPGSDAEDWEAFRPDFASFDVVLSNYNGQLWPRSVRKLFEAFVRQGGGFVAIHAANNAFPEWDAYNSIIGLGWRDASFGDRIYLDGEGQLVRVPAGTGDNAGHSRVHPFEVVVRDAEHPIMRDLPAKWMHAPDELYHSQRGPARNMQLLATAYASPDAHGSGKHEPVVWAIRFGEGRVVVNLLGHVWSTTGTASMRCVGFKALLLRSSE